MTGSPGGLVALYNGLSERLGSELAEALIAFLPTAPAEELATKADLARLEVRIDRLTDEVRALSQRMDERFGHMDERFERMDERFDSMERRVGRMEERFERVDERFEGLFGRMDDRTDSLSKRIDRQHYTMMAGFVALTSALIASGLVG